MPAPQIPQLRQGAQGLEKLLAELQVNVNKALTALYVGSAILDGRLIASPDGKLTGSTPLVITPAGVELAHGLGRAFKGYLVVRKDAESDVWEVATSYPDRTLRLASSARVTVTLWVF